MAKARHRMHLARGGAKSHEEIGKLPGRGGRRPLIRRRR